MIIFKDAYSGDELFTDSNAIVKDCDCELYRVVCREVKQEAQNDFNIGANASQEEQAEELEKCVTCGIDIVLNHHLEDITYLYESKKEYLKYLKSYLKKLDAKGDKDDGQCFRAAGVALAKEIQQNFDDIQFFRPKCDYEKEVKEGEEPFIIPLHRNPTTGEITMLFLKRGLVEEKC